MVTKIGLKTKLKEIFPVLNRETQTIEMYFFNEMNTRIYYKILAVETAVNLISNTLSLAEFKTFETGKEVKKTNYYLFNIEPNKNQNANRFWRELYHSLVYENEALVIMKDGYLHVADSFIKHSHGFMENYYTDVVVNNFKLKEVLYEEDVFYFTLHSEKMNNVISSIFSDYGELIEYSKNHYKKANAKKGILNIPTNFGQTEKQQQQLKDLLENRFKDFFQSESGAVLPLTNGMEYIDLSGSTYKNSSDSRDVRNLIDDVFDYVAIAFQIPPQILKGSVADSDTNWSSYMTHCIKPLSELIEDEINRKFYDKEDYLKRTYLKIDTNNIKHSDLKELASAIDLLTRNGVNTLNDNLRLLGREELQDEMKDLRFMTLNITPLDRVLEGGDYKKYEQEITKQDDET